MDIEMGSIPSIKDELELEKEQKEESARSDLRLDEHKMIEEEEEEEEDIEDIDRGSAETPNHDMEFPNIPPVLTVTNGSNIAIIHWLGIIYKSDINESIHVIAHLQMVTMDVYYVNGSMRLIMTAVL